MENIPCPLCGNSQHKLLFLRADHTHQVTAEPFKIVRCRGCGFVFVNPRPDASEIHQYYPEEFYETNITREAILEHKRETLSARLALLEDIPPGSILDVGCQKGEFLEAMKRKGWTVQGVEFSGKPPNLFNLPIHYGTLESAKFAPNSFDVITLWAVLEHVHDPLSVLRKVRALLRESGRAFVLVPNFNSIPGRIMRHDDVPRHLLMFTKATFRAAARASGFRIRHWYFGDDIFSGSTRGVLNYLYKLLHGEQIEDIVAQNRSPNRWDEFSNFVNGERNELMLKIDRIDIKLSPYLDRLVNALHMGFIMTVEIEPSRQ